jgi:peptide-methionine (R)-S-oxide reductase
MSAQADTLALVAALLVGSCMLGQAQEPRSRPRESARPDEGKADASALDGKVVKSDAEWRRELTPAQYLVLRRKATEPPFSGRYAVGHFRGIFTCAGCGAELFSSTHKYNSGTGWPSFYRPLRRDALEQEMDYSAAEVRVEVMCARCGGHLGHVFSDGPPPTGLRYCINSAALKLKQPTAASSRASEKTRARPSAKAPPPAEGPETPTSP